MKKPANTDEYIAGFPADIQLKLEDIREIIKKAAPSAEEVISYAMPGYRQDGMLVWFAGYKNHIGFYPTGGPIITFREDLEGYTTSKGAIQFPLDKPLPKNLIKKIVKYRIAQNSEKAMAKEKKKK
jgi:uncharacterized protein YdhG (YjbR/CyaY superfamily)